LPRWWLLIVFVLFGGAAQLLRMPVPGPGAAHLPLRPGSILVAVGSLLIGMGAAARLPLWVAGFGLVVLAIGFWQVRGHALGSRMTIRGPEGW
jgi:hypothetical protein